MIALDDRDLRILVELQRDGRMTKTALADRVSLSAAACWERLRRLEQAGLITGYQASIDARLLSGAVTVMVPIELKSHRAVDQKTFEKYVTTVREIVDCWSVGGGIDYLLRIVAKDIETYQTVIDDLLARDLGIERYYTYIVTREVKRAPLPLDLIAKTG